MAKENERVISGKLYVTGEIETKVQPSLISQHKTERIEDAKVERKRFWVDVVTMLIVLAYTTISAISMARCK